MCTLFVARVAQISNLRLALVGRRSHKNLDRGRHVKVKRLSEFLTCGRFWKNTSTLRVCLSASWQFHGFWTGATIERIARMTVNRVGRRRWKRSSVALSAATSTTSIERMAWAFIDLRGTRNFDDVCWVASLRLQSLPETAKICRKNTMVNERSIDGAKKRKWRKKKISTHLLLGETLRGRLVMSKSLSTPSRTSNWRKMRANSGKSTATAVDLRAVVRRWVSELSPRARHKSKQQTQSCLRSLSKHSPHWHQNVFPLEKQADTSPSLDRFRFHRTELQLQLRLFHPPYCTPLLVVASTEWLHYFAKQKKWEQNHRQTTMKKCYSFQKPSLDA